MAGQKYGYSFDDAHQSTQYFFATNAHPSPVVRVHIDRIKNDASITRKMNITHFLESIFLSFHSRERERDSILYTQVIFIWFNIIRLKPSQNIPKTCLEGGGTITSTGNCAVFIYCLGKWIPSSDSLNCTHKMLVFGWWECVRGNSLLLQKKLMS